MSIKAVSSVTDTAIVSCDDVIATIVRLVAGGRQFEYADKASRLYVGDLAIGQGVEALLYDIRTEDFTIIRFDAESGEVYILGGNRSLARKTGARLVGMNLRQFCEIMSNAKERDVFDAVKEPTSSVDGISYPKALRKSSFDVTADATPVSDDLVEFYTEKDLEVCSSQSDLTFMVASCALLAKEHLYATKHLAYDTSDTMGSSSLNGEPVPAAGTPVPQSSIAWGLTPYGDVRLSVRQVYAGNVFYFSVDGSSLTDDHASSDDNFAQKKPLITVGAKFDTFNEKDPVIEEHPNYAGFRRVMRNSVSSALCTSLQFGRLREMRLASAGSFTDVYNQNFVVQAYK